MHFIHGMSNAKIYGVWSAMLDRCNNPNSSHYKYYGAKGIKVCKRWRKFENFYADMGTPKAKFSIERIDNNGNYTLQNCKWIPRALQAQNKSNNTYLVVDRKKACLSEWARITGIHQGTLSRRLALGWKHAEIINTKPLDKKKRDKEVAEAKRLIASGMGKELAAKKVGIGYMTLYRHLRRSKEYLS